MDNKVNYYYNRIEELVFEIYHKSFNSLSSNNRPIKRILKEIIDSNKEYLLTDAFLYFMVGSSTQKSLNIREEIYINLNSLITSETDSINILTNYVYAIHGRSFWVNYLYSFYSVKKLKECMNDFENDLEEIYDKRCVIEHSNNTISDKEYILSIEIITIIAAYCLLKQDTIDFDDLVFKYTNNLSYTMEDLSLQGIYDEPSLLKFDVKDWELKRKEFINYIINNPKEKSKIRIY